MRAVVADEWSVLRGGVAAVLAQCGVSTPLQATTGTEAVAAVEATPYDLVVLGAVPDVAPATAVARLRAVRPAVRVLVLLEAGSRGEAIEVLDAGADAVLSRTATEVDLREATVRLTLGQRYVSPGMLESAFGGGSPDVAAQGGAPAFTDRERAVMAHLVEGRSNREIAAALFIGEATVKTHLRNIYDKLDVSNRVQAVNKVVELKLLR
jgi:DNA-binding NarL/FixJ family response regulator